MNREVKILEGQTIFDIAIQEYGTINGLKDLMEKNPESITHLDVELPVGTILNIGQPINEAVVNHFSNKNYKLVSNYNLPEASTDNGIFADEFGDEFE